MKKNGMQPTTRVLDGENRKEQQVASIYNNASYATAGNRILNGSTV